MLRSLLTFLVLRGAKLLTHLLFEPEAEWVGAPPPEPGWPAYRLVAILNHTSLYEILFAAICPDRFLRRIAEAGVVPIAEKTIRRPIVGRFWSLVAKNVVPVSRSRDHTWDAVLRAVHEGDVMVMLLPEGRMKRADGNDARGRPLVVRSGIADLIERLGDGRMLIAYSLGLHHIQVPGQLLPRLFQPVRLRLEDVDLGEYRAQMMEGATPEEYRQRVVEDLTARRDRHCDPSTWT